MNSQNVFSSVFLQKLYVLTIITFMYTFYMVFKLACIFFFLATFFTFDGNFPDVQTAYEAQDIFGLLIQIHAGHNTEFPAHVPALHLLI